MDNYYFIEVISKGSNNLYLVRANSEDEAHDEVKKHFEFSALFTAGIIEIGSLLETYGINNSIFKIGT